MERTIGVDKARTSCASSQRRSRPRMRPSSSRAEARRAVLVSPAEYDRLTETRRRMAQEELRARLDQVRQSVADAGLDVSVVDEAITAARSAE